MKRFIYTALRVGLVFYFKIVMKQGLHLPLAGSHERNPFVSADSDPSRLRVREQGGNQSPQKGILFGIAGTSRAALQVALLLCMMSLLGGCFYPQEKKLQLDQLETHVSQVQSAVELYEKEKKVLPYRYQEDEIKFTSKATVDFKELQAYLNQIPPSAFEEGGNFIYVLTDVEQKPLVRLFDLRLSNQVDKAQIMVSNYQQKNKQLPIKEKLTNTIFTIDYQKIGIEEITIPSPYDPQANLSLIMDAQGKVRVDYRIEVMKMMQKAKQKPDSGEDLRIWMTKQSLYVPAFSLPMKVEKNEPVFIEVQE